MITNSGKESFYNEGDTVEIVNGDYNLMCGERLYSRETPGHFTVTAVEYEMGGFTYTLTDYNGHVVRDVQEHHMRQVRS